MLRLWRDEIYAGLFGSAALLNTGKSSQLQHALAPSAAEPAALLATVLDTSAQLRKPGKGLVVTLGGPSCSFIALPWSGDVRTAEEKEAYARAHFEQAGQSVGELCLVHAEFRHFGAQGIAYAVPSALLDALRTVALENQLKLVNAMPVAAAAYYAARLPRANDTAVTLLVEEHAVSALAFDEEGLSAFDAEPAFGGPAAALRRLLLRLDTGAKPYARIELWSPLEQAAEFEGVVKELAPQSPLHVLEPSHWWKFQ